MPIPFHGHTATLVVVRNDGHCWGEITDAGLHWTVDTIRSHVADDDAHALLSFARACKCTANVWLSHP
jgi:hypothetical protein